MSNPLPAVVDNIVISVMPNAVRGELVNCCSSHLDIYINGSFIVQIPVVQGKLSDKQSFMFKTHPTFLDALPHEYTVKFLESDTGRLLGESSDIGESEGNGDLFSKLEDGYMVSAKGGYLFKPPSLDRRWKSDILTAYNLARQALNEACVDEKYDLFLAYGSLLGAIRSGEFIAHDDDFDAGFFIKVDSIEEAASKFHEIYRSLEKLGYKVWFKNHVGNLNIKFKDLPPVEIWMFYYLRGTKELCGYNIAVECDGEQAVEPLKKIEFVDNFVMVPNSPELLLEATYGAGWRVPDPSFQWRTTELVKRYMKKYELASKKHALETS